MGPAEDCPDLPCVFLLKSNFSRDLDAIRWGEEAGLGPGGRSVDSRTWPSGPDRTGRILSRVQVPYNHTFTGISWLFFCLGRREAVKARRAV